MEKKDTVHRKLAAKTNFSFSLAKSLRALIWEALGTSLKAKLYLSFGKEMKSECTSEKTVEADTPAMRMCRAPLSLIDLNTYPLARSFT
jgi:hypothetical protein